MRGELNVLLKEINFFVGDGLFKLSVSIDPLGQNNSRPIGHKINHTVWNSNNCRCVHTNPPLVHIFNLPDTFVYYPKCNTFPSSVSAIRSVCSSSLVQINFVS
jgi:hypothetical protein